MGGISIDRGVPVMWCYNVISGVNKRVKMC